MTCLSLSLFSHNWKWWWWRWAVEREREEWLRTRQRNSYFAVCSSSFLFSSFFLFFFNLTPSLALLLLPSSSIIVNRACVGDGSTFECENERYESFRTSRGAAETLLRSSWWVHTLSLFLSFFLLSFSLLFLVIIISFSHSLSLSFLTSTSLSLLCRVPVSEMEYSIIGLYLLHLLSSNRHADFLMEIELVSLSSSSSFSLYLIPSKLISFSLILIAFPLFHPSFSSRISFCLLSNLSCLSLSQIPIEKHESNHHIRSAIQIENWLVEGLWRHS